jgi:hypothetical protein
MVDRTLQVDHDAKFQSGSHVSLRTAWHGYARCEGNPPVDRSIQIIPQLGTEGYPPISQVRDQCLYRR